MLVGHVTRNHWEYDDSISSIGAPQDPKPRIGFRETMNMEGNDMEAGTLHTEGQTEGLLLSQGDALSHWYSKNAF